MGANCPFFLIILHHYYLMISSYTVIGSNNHKMYHVQAYTSDAARNIYKQQTGRTAMKVIKE